MKSTLLAPLSGALLLLAACGAELEEQQPSTATSEHALETPNGIAFNGRAFNARSFNGIAFNGRAFNGGGYGGAGFEGIGSNGITFAGYTLIARQSELTLINANARPHRLTFADLGGAVNLTARGADPTLDVTVRIEGPMTVQSVGLRKPVLAYLVRVWDPATPGWAPAYADGAGNALWTIPLNGLWNIAPEDLGTPIGGARVDDPAAITFAARGYTLAKCVEMGYRAWETPALHQTCVRAMRADYCGDGRSFTRDGTMIDIFDFRGLIQPETSPPGPGLSWTHEGNWTESGASCLSSERVQDWAAGESPAPFCAGVPLSAKYISRCGAVDRRGSPIWADDLIRTRHPAP